MSVVYISATVLKFVLTLQAALLVRVTLDTDRTVMEEHVTVRFLNNSYILGINNSCLVLFNVLNVKLSYKNLAIKNIY